MRHDNALQPMSLPPTFARTTRLRCPWAWRGFFAEGVESAYSRVPEAGSHRRSASPENAGVASGISETTAEFGGALGIAVLGSIGTAVYRGEVADVVSEGIPPDVVACLELISTRSTA
jgi:hypothetical protein